MTLREYIKQNSLTPDAMAKLLGCSEGAVRKWCSGERTPRPDQMRTISEVTAGAVLPNDFFVSSPEAA